MQKTRKFGILFFSVISVICFVLAFLTFSMQNTKIVNAEETTKTIGRYVDVTSTESTSTSAFGQKGRQLTPAAYSATAQARSYVMHVPDDLEGTATITSTSATSTRVKMRYNYTRQLGFRVIHYKASEGVNEVIYPLDGGWHKYSYTSTYFMNEDGLSSITVSAGDKLYFSVKALASGGYRETYLYLYLNITYNGTTSTWVNDNTDSVTCSHVGTLAADATTTTSDFYGGTYTYGELLTYELSTITDNVSETTEITETGFSEKFNPQLDQYCATPTFSTTEEGESYLTASSWSGYGYLTKEKDYRLDLTFKRTSGNLGVYFNCANDYAGDKTDGYVLNFYNGAAILYNQPITSGWYSDNSQYVVECKNDYSDGEWHNLSIYTLNNKFYIMIDGALMIQSVVYSDANYSNGVYTATENFGLSYIRLLGSGFSIKNFSLTWFDYSDEVANAQFDTTKSLNEKVNALNESSYSEDCWNIIKDLETKSYTDIFNASSKTGVETISAVFEKQIDAIKTIYDTVNTLKQSDYDTACWNIIKNIQETACVDIGNATTVEEVETLLATALQAISDTPFKEEDLPVEDVLVGYYIEGTGYNGFYAPTVDLTDANITAYKEVYARLDMVEGASIRISTQTPGLRFSSKIKTEYVNVFKDYAIKYEFGTLIAKAEDLMLDGVVDSSLLTVDSTVTKLNIVSTTQVEKESYTYINGALVDIKQDHYDWDFVGRGYLQITYADGSSAVFYANPSSNVRSVKDVARLAYNDLSETKTEKYAYETPNGYSPYDTEDLDIIEKFFNNGEVLPEKKVNANKQSTSIHLLDVNSNYDGAGGSANANCFIILHNDKVILIDGGWGTEETQNRIINYMNGLGIKRIDHLVLTHAHGDHAGGLPAIINEFDVGTLYAKAIDWDANNLPTAKAYHNGVVTACEEKINSNGITVKIVEPDEEGMRITLDEETYFEIYNCTTIHDIVGLDYNYYSMEVFFVSGTAKAFLAGDAAKKADEFVIGKVGKVDLFTMQHHGTHGGSTGAYNSNELLAELQPTYSVATGPATTMPAAAARNVCELYGQVMNTGSDGHLVFDKTEGKFVARYNDETVMNGYQKVNIAETAITPTEGASAIYYDSCKIASDVYIKGGTNSCAAYVLTVPASFSGVATVVFDNSIIYKSSNSQTTSAASMRIVLNDRVVFPADGGWQDLTDTYSGNKYYFDCSVKVKAGDRLYFIVDSSATIYAPMACRIDQLYFTVAKVNHVDSTNNTVVATENFFNGLLFSGTGSKYTREDLMSYASVVVTDVVENNDTLTYALVKDSQPQIISVRNVDYVVYNEEKNKNVGELVA